MIPAIPVLIALLGLFLLGIAAIGVSHPRYNFLAAGLFCWLLATMLGAFHAA